MSTENHRNKVDRRSAYETELQRKATVDSLKNSPNYLPEHPYANGIWNGKEIEAFKSEAYGCVVFYKNSDIEVDVELDDIPQLLDCLKPI